MTHVAAAVQARGVTKWFGERTALDRVDISVEVGGVHGLVGPNGAGKTTLLSVLLGLCLPDEGEVSLFGRMGSDADRDRLEGVGGFVEAPAFYPYLSGRRNLRALAELDGYGATAASLDAVLETVGLTDAARVRVRGYSLGMRQRLGLAAALLRRPRLLILDEPTNGLDPAGVRDLLTAIRTLARDGVAILLSSHDMTQIDGMCDAVTVLCAGRVAFSGDLEQMRTRAPAPSWHLATSDDPRAASVAADVGGLAVAAADGGGLRIEGHPAELDSLTIALGRSGIAVRLLTQESTALESLFFALTGTEASS